MVTLVNFSHPLNAKAERILRDRYGVTVIHTVPVQLDIDLALEPQLVAIEREALALVGGNQYNVDCVVLPGHSVADEHLARQFPTANIVVMTVTPGPVRQYMPTEIIRR